jgi:uncharacterized protein YbjT (DUF2867 family)
MEFFRTAGTNLLAAEASAGVRHHVALTIVGAERLPDSGYLRAKVAQEELIEASGVPYTIVRATQFFEFLRAIADAGTEGDTVRLPSANLQPIAARDVAAAVSEAAVGEPVGGTIEIGGPEPIGMDVLVRRVLAADGDERTVIGDPHARYFGAELDDRSLTPGAGARLGATDFEAWLAA